MRKRAIYKHIELLTKEEAYKAYYAGKRLDWYDMIGILISRAPTISREIKGPKMQVKMCKVIERTINKVVKEFE